jgi:hypothetical protein
VLVACAGRADPPSFPPFAVDGAPGLVFPLKPPDVSEELQAIGLRKVIEDQDSFSHRNGVEIPSLGPCMRIDDDARIALRKRVVAWINTTTAATDVEDREAEELEIRYGCSEPSGIVVDVHLDRLSRTSKLRAHVDVGRWWVLRVGDRSVRVLGETTSKAIATLGESESVTTQTVLGLTDLDRDGTMDPVLAVTEQGGGVVGNVALRVASSKQGKTVFVATFGDSVELARVQGQAQGPLVLEISNRGAFAFRCVDETLQLVHCNEAVAARRARGALEAAQYLRFARVTPDREHLAELLALVGIPDADRRRLLAACRRRRRDVRDDHRPRGGPRVDRGQRTRRALAGAASRMS